MKNACKLSIILFLTLLVVSPILSCPVRGASGTTVMAEAYPKQPQIGETLTVNIKIANVANLFALDVTLNWNSSVLHVLTATNLLGVESHSNGVLHETSTYPIYVAQDNTSQSIGEYHLVATSTGSASSFNGSGTIVTLTFNVTCAGDTGLALETLLADHPLAGQSASLIDHSDTVVFVDAPPSSNPILDSFDWVIIIIIIVVVAAIAIVVAIILKKRSRKK